MSVFTFHRDGGMFYPVELASNQEAVENAILNPGTLKVLDMDGREVWTRPEGLEHQVVPYAEIEAYVEAEREVIRGLLAADPGNEVQTSHCRGRQAQLSSLLLMVFGNTVWRN